jgi:DNA-binding MarR family transcriptional regulator
MLCNKNELFQAYQKLIEMEAKLQENEVCECQALGITVKQVYYLKIIDQNQRVTFSQLAQETQNSKPTISELISKFISMDCVYRQQSDEDRRVYYIYLTPKGQSIARAQENTHVQFIEHIRNKLTEAELKELIRLLNKIL